MSILTGTNNKDILNGTAKDDIIHGLNGDDTIYGMAGNDKLYGDNGDDTIYGGAGNDTIYGGTGDDIIDGGTGKNMLIGGAGDDTYHLALGENSVTIDLGDSFLTIPEVQEIMTHKMDMQKMHMYMDCIDGFDKNDKIYLDIDNHKGNKGIAADAKVNTLNDTEHFKNYSIKDGIMTLKNGDKTVTVNSEALLKEAFTYAIKNLAQLPNDVAVGIHLNLKGQPAETLVIVDHAQPGFTSLGIVGTLESLSHSQFLSIHP
jgi:Ca2+-binding RTX toxin-like protein